MPSFTDRLAHAWNAFRNRDPTDQNRDLGHTYMYRPNTNYTRARNNGRSVVVSIYNKMALDVAQVEFAHAKFNVDEDRLESIEKDNLHNCLSLEANLDQTARAFKQDVVLSLFDEGVVAVVPTQATNSPLLTDSYDIGSMRVGKIVKWYPKHVMVQLYNEDTGEYVDLTFPKKMVAIIENPYYAVMNESNSVLQRLVRKLDLLDAVDEQSSSGKLDMIIQLPYVIKTEKKKQEAEKRRSEIEEQLSGSKYGIAYADGTERITQLNRSVENNLLNQVQYLTDMLYGQLGITPEILNGSADENVMTNYYSRTIEPICAAIADEMKRKFLTKTARTQGHTIMFYRDPFKLVPITQMPDIVDKMARNEIMTANEIRGKIGLKPFNDPKADRLVNSNISMSKEAEAELEMERGHDEIAKVMLGEGKNQQQAQKTGAAPPAKPKEEEEGGKNQNGSD